MPLYPFGYGLSYTSYRYSAVRLSSPSMIVTGNVTVSVDVTNTGQRKGDEVVELYIHQKVSSVTRPVKELKNFSRIALEAGETKTVTFVVDASTLAFWTKECSVDRYGRTVHYPHKHFLESSVE